MASEGNAMTDHVLICATGTFGPWCNQVLWHFNTRSHPTTNCKPTSCPTTRDQTRKQQIA